ncbi:thiamine ABC transporter substrate-binding protein [Conchiformibius steedae]|uniref:Thiamine ABC transporter substrate-binding protein n=1 Tax=Conchiformibius steedae TaxID=153493 RepID=A0A3P2AA65_9NEIS|nr:thiamine ABC transporter substrate-binding protein [Conchiformibius steedae]RRD90523.1 thiamine ABC transporter substrate-binding protein [Conchiformibius steedae]
MTILKNLLACAAVLLAHTAAAATEVRLAVHDSFDLPKSLLAKFEQQHDAKVVLIKAGDGNELLNRLIISKNQPIADAVYGLDNGNAEKARSAGVLAAQQPESAPTVITLSGMLAVDYGFVALNYDKKWFAEKKLPLPKSLHDLAQPQYKDLTVMPNPATSTPGMAFLLANIGGLGENQAFAWWAKMRQNGVKITKGWSEAYNTEFSLNGGARPIMVGYASSPAAEVFYSKNKKNVPDMGNLFLNGGVYRQIEGAAVLNKAQQPVLAAKLVQYLQSPAVQAAVPTAMWVYPAVRGTPLPAVMKHASLPKQHWSPNDKRIADNRKAWVSRWTKTVLK